MTCSPRKRKREREREQRFVDDNDGRNSADCFSSNIYRLVFETEGNEEWIERFFERKKLYGVLRV